MGLHVDVSSLSQEECSKIIAVITKDLALRRTDQWRIRKLKKDFDETRKAITLKSSKRGFSDDRCFICGRLVLKFFCFFKRIQKCLTCEHMACSTCRRVLMVEKHQKHFLCFLCVKKRDVKRKCFDWFYETVEQRFKRFGSAKVLRGIYRCHKADSRVISLINQSRELINVCVKISSSRRSSVLKIATPFTTEESCLSSEDADNKEKTTRSKSTDDLLHKRLKPATKPPFRKLSAPAKINIQFSNIDKEVVICPLETTAEEKRQTSSESSGFEVISVTSKDDFGNEDKKSSYTVKIIGDIEFILLASAAFVLATFFSIIACVGYIDDFCSDSEEDDKSD